MLINLRSSVQNHKCINIHKEFYHHYIILNVIILFLIILNLNN